MRAVRATVLLATAAGALAALAAPGSAETPRAPASLPQHHGLREA